MSLLRVLLLDHLFNLSLVALVLAACSVLGLRLLRRLGCSDLRGTPQTLLSMALGLGAVAYGVFALGLVGLFRPEILALATAALVAGTARDVVTLLPPWREAALKGFAGLRRLSGYDRFLLLLGSGGFLVALSIGLAPPTDYDGLMYHLAVPARFLDVGRIYPMPDLVQANFPFTAEMVYSLGLALGSDVFGRLVNLALWVALAVGTFWIGSRYLQARTGFLGALAFLTAPGAYLAGSTCVELLWGLFTMAGVISFFQWVDRGGIRWVALMGIFGGLVLGTKELAVGLPLALGAGLAIHLLFLRRTGPLATVGTMALFAAVTLAVASPWYLKNWIWLGSPLFPLFTPLDEWARYYLTTAGIPKDPIGLLILPVAVFFPPNPWTFSVPMPSYFFLSYLFLAVPTVVLARRSLYLNYLLLFSAAFFAVWAAGYQLLRFLYPAYPLFGLLAAHGLVEGRVHGRGVSPGWARRLMALFLVVALSLQLVMLAAVQPFGVLVGQESPDAFLSRSSVVPTYPAVRWANEHLPEGSRLFLVGSGQSYYLRHQALPDSTVSNLDRLLSEAPTPDRAAALLRRRGFTHLLFSDADVGWHTAFRDPDGRLRRQVGMIEEMLKDHAALTYRDGAVRIYRLTSTE